jgi:hypothetical protein
MTQAMFMSGLRKRMMQEQGSQDLRAQKPEIVWGGAEMIDPFANEPSGDKEIDKAFTSPVEHMYPGSREKLQGWSAMGYPTRKEAYDGLNRHANKTLGGRQGGDYHKLMSAGVMHIQNQHMAAPYEDAGEGKDFLSRMKTNHDSHASISERLSSGNRPRRVSGMANVAKPLPA